MLVPPNLKSFFEPTEKDKLFQGDVLCAREIGLKDETVFSPDFWMIISKSCDVQIEESGRTRRQIISVIPTISLNLVEKIYGRDTLNTLNRLGKKIVMIPLVAFTQAFLKLKSDDVSDLLKNRLSKFMYLPPDGAVLNDPMVVDFDITQQLPATSSDQVRKVLMGKKLQLVSPFRERVAQRFAEHYSSIGLNDEFIRSDGYKKELKTYLSEAKKNSPSV